LNPLQSQHEGCFDVNAQTSDGRTPLFFAAVDGSLPCIQALLLHDANAHILTKEGKDAHSVAKLFKHDVVAQALSDALALPPPLPKRLAPPSADAKKAREAEDALRAKAEEYAAKKPTKSEWKKADFSKWSNMTQDDWEGLEAEQELATSPEPPRREALRVGKGEGGGYGRGKIGPPAGFQVGEGHPRRKDFLDYLEMKKKWEARASNKHPSGEEPLLSFKPPPEGGERPSDSNGGRGPGYTWSQTPSEVVISVEVTRDHTKADVTCEVKPRHVTVEIGARGGMKRALSVFRGARLWGAVKAEESFWTLAGGNALTVTLTKLEAKWWRCVTDMEGHPKIDSTMCRGPDMLSEYEGEAEQEMRQFFSKHLSRPI